jgi:hypothetical protein
MAAAPNLYADALLDALARVFMQAALERLLEQTTTNEDDELNLQPRSIRDEHGRTAFGD